MAVVLFLSVILIRSFPAGVIGVEPLSAQSAARFWGAPGNTKAMLATPQDRVAGCSFGGFFSMERWVYCGGNSFLTYYTFAKRKFSAGFQCGIICDATWK